MALLAYGLYFKARWNDPLFALRLLKSCEKEAWQAYSVILRMFL